MKKRLCEYCGKRKRVEDQYCEKCFNRLADWKIVDVKGKLTEFDSMTTERTLRFLREEILDLFIKLQQLKNYLVETETINDSNFMAYCKAASKRRKIKT